MPIATAQDRARRTGLDGSLQTRVHGAAKRKIGGLGARGVSTGVKVLTFGPLRLRGPGRFADDSGAQPDYIVAQMARQTLGGHWLAALLARANAGGIARVLF